MQKQQREYEDEPEQEESEQDEPKQEESEQDEPEQDGRGMHGCRYDRGQMEKPCWY